MCLRLILTATLLGRYYPPQFSDEETRLTVKKQKILFVLGSETAVLCLFSPNKNANIDYFPVFLLMRSSLSVTSHHFNFH